MMENWLPWHHYQALFAKQERFRQALKSLPVFHCVPFFGKKAMDACYRVNDYKVDFSSICFSASVAIPCGNLLINALCNLSEVM